MEKVIRNIMQWANVSEEELQESYNFCKQFSSFDEIL